MCSGASGLGLRGRGSSNVEPLSGDGPSCCALRSGHAARGCVPAPRRGVQGPGASPARRRGLRALPLLCSVPQGRKPLSIPTCTPPWVSLSQRLCLWPPGVALAPEPGRGGRGGFGQRRVLLAQACPLGKGVPLPQWLWGFGARPGLTGRGDAPGHSFRGRGRLGPKHPGEAEREGPREPELGPWLCPWLGRRQVKREPVTWSRGRGGGRAGWGSRGHPILCGDRPGPPPGSPGGVCPRKPLGSSVP